MSESRVQLQLGELPRESRVLLELLKNCIRADEPTSPARDQNLGCDPHLLVTLARQNRVAPLLRHALKQSGFLLADDPALQKLHCHYRHNAARALQLSHALANLLDRLSRQIDVIPFKGPMLAAGAYGDISLREAGDLDLLVKQQDIVRAADLLASLGHRPIFPTSTPREAAFLQTLTGDRRARYLRRHCEHHLVSDPSQINVDLHWAIALREFSLEIDTDALWRRARTISFQGCPTLAMCPEDELLVLCVNGAKDCWNRLNRVCDLAMLLTNAPSLDWDLIVTSADKVRTRRIVLLGPALTNGLLGAPLPAGIVDEINRDQTLGVIASRMGRKMLLGCSTEPSSRLAGFLFLLRMRDGWRERYEYCIAQLRPGVGDWSALPLPEALSFLHYVVRPFRLLGRHLLGDSQERQVS